MLRVVFGLLLALMTFAVPLAQSSPIPCTLASTAAELLPAGAKSRASWQQMLSLRIQMLRSEQKRMLWSASHGQSRVLDDPAWVVVRLSFMPALSRRRPQIITVPGVPDTKQPATVPDPKAKDQRSGQTGRTAPANDHAGAKKGSYAADATQLQHVGPPSLQHMGQYTRTGKKPDPGIDCGKLEASLSNFALGNLAANAASATLMPSQDPLWLGVFLNVTPLNHECNDEPGIVGHVASVGICSILIHSRSRIVYGRSVASKL
ncbi:hypothetical protein IE81DRAFT_342523 [Ceraceosorus guamensis]|uniref:Uncharacterized protein n=1 Tax=Ceraceosorus guamensis TaxID=1522189 RepID=A0A316VT12_9BASI|nr:hypothetical protein IE81DRAFT_342523 [Ceraceosorus guamensis]PWN40727.1 hypothetical protein IE81DRAFT_342523 [Ceraceosorus guamensis]